jgi:ribosome assembly protein YihI (activator of Der GTPase)
MFDTEHKRAQRGLDMVNEIKNRLETKQSILSSPNAYHLILSEHMKKKEFTPKTAVEMFEEQADINALLDDGWDINNSILADEPLELAQEQEFYESRFLEHYEEAMETVFMSEDELEEHYS